MIPTLLSTMATATTTTASEAVIIPLQNMDPISAALAIIIGGVLVGICVHFIPASAVGAMSASTGIATGPSMLSFGAGLSGLISAAYMMDEGLLAAVMAGAAGSSLMMMLTILGGNIANAFGTGVSPVSGQTATGQSIMGASTKDVLTGFDQKPHMTPGTDGHGMPVQTQVSGIIGAVLGGSGGALVFFAVTSLLSAKVAPANIVTLAGFVTSGIFLINCVLPAYTLVGKTEGIFDQKTKRIHKTFLSCLIVSGFLAAMIYIIAEVI